MNKELLLKEKQIKFNFAELKLKLCSEIVKLPNLQKELEENERKLSQNHSRFPFARKYKSVEDKINSSSKNIMILMQKTINRKLNITIELQEFYSKCRPRCPTQTHLPACAPTDTGGVPAKRGRKTKADEAVCVCRKCEHSKKKNLESWKKELESLIKQQNDKFMIIKEKFEKIPNFLIKLDNKKLLRFKNYREILNFFGYNEISNLEISTFEISGEFIYKEILCVFKKFEELYFDDTSYFKEQQQLIKEDIEFSEDKENIGAYEKQRNIQESMQERSNVLTREIKESKENIEKFKKELILKQELLDEATAQVEFETARINLESFKINLESDSA